MSGVAQVQAATRVDPGFEAVFRSELGYVWKTLERLGVPNRDVEDVAHDVFVAVYRNFDHYDITRPIRPWLCGFAYRTASDYRRLARNRYERTAHDGDMDAPDSDRAARRIEARDLTLRALDQVELERRVVLMMHDIDGHAAPDIARELSIPVNTVYSRLRLARDEFRRAVNELQGGVS
ncbi:MAG: sigma-70 family RNA polymerase sigma factor [Polyangiaceae bacterium]